MRSALYKTNTLSWIFIVLARSQSLEGEISLPELTSALKRMKNNKSPGSDGFTAYFFKFFWIDVGKFVFRCVNYGYQQKKMSVTQRQGVITCIPKEGKSKEFLKKIGVQLPS